MSRWWWRCIIGGVLIALVGGDPFATYGHIANVAFGSLGGITDTLTKATPLILVGLACSLAFRMKLWNIGAEGQFFIGAWAASAVVLLPILPPETSPIIFIPVMMIAGMLGGAAWGFIPGFLKARFKVNEVITTLMLNYIAVAWNNFWIFAVWSEGGFQMSPMFPRTAWLPRLSDLAAQIKDFRGLTLHGGFIIAVIAAVIVWFIMNRSKWGYEIRLIGDNPRAAEYAGIPIKRNIILVMMVSGALAGLAGMSEISGMVHRLQGRHLAGLRLYGHHHRVAGQAQSVRGDHRVDLLRRAAAGRTRDSTFGHPQDDSGHRAGLPHRQRFLRALSGAHRPPGGGVAMDLIIILQAGVASGTVLLFATIGEIFAERSGVMNLGVEGMMLIGAMSAFSVAVHTGNPWLGVLVAMLAAGLLSQIHAFLTITCNPIKWSAASR